MLDFAARARRCGAGAAMRVRRTDAAGAVFPNHTGWLADFLANGREVSDDNRQLGPAVCGAGGEGSRLPAWRWSTIRNAGAEAPAFAWGMEAAREASPDTRRSFNLVG